jgi:hypothetical protein
MAAVLDKGIASKLRNSFQATPGVTRDQVQTFSNLLEGLQKPGLTEADAERQLRSWMEKAPRHAVTVVRAAALGSSYMRSLPPDSWLFRVFGPAKAKT